MCLYYYNQFPIYSDISHFSLFQLKYYAKRIEKLISLYVETNKKNIYNKKCPYYHMPNSYYVMDNINNQKCHRKTK